MTGRDQDPEIDDVGEELAALLGPRGSGRPTQREGGTLPPALEHEIAAKQGPLAALRSRPTPQRVAFAVLLVLACAAFVLGVTRRPDLGLVPVARMLLDFGLLAVPFVAALFVALRPLHRPPLPSSAHAVLVVAAALALAVLASLPAPHHDHPASLVGIGDGMGRYALGCFAFGSAFAAVIVLGLRALSRGTGPMWLPTIAVAVASALAGVLLLWLHCPIVHPQHLWLGHAPVLVPLLALGFLLGRRSTDG